MLSKLKRANWILCGLVGLCSFLPAAGHSVQAQSADQAVIRLIPADGRVVIEVRGDQRARWSFLDSYAGVIGLGSRVRDFTAEDAKGAPVSVRTIAPGQFESAAPASSFKYEQIIAAPGRPSDAALVSWLNAERGVLMLADLLPISKQSTRITIEVEAPPGWTIYSNDQKPNSNSLEVTDVNRAILIVGRELRSSSRNTSGTALTFTTDRRWSFPDAEALDLATRILSAHRETIGPVPCGRASVLLLPFPVPTSADKWSAQTRGCTVLLLMGALPTRVGALSQLGNSLSHELLHLWFPNGVTLQGDYDWFYEGFTVYQGARMAVRLDLLTFNDFLNAMAQANDGITRAPDLNRWSLIEASQRRWTGGQSAVYSKAMLVAFLYDLNLRFQSKGKRSLDAVYKRLGSEYTGAQKQNAEGNAAVLGAMRAEFDGQNFAQRFIGEPYAIDLQKEIAPFGLQVEKFGPHSRIVVGDHLSKRQRDLLRDLGYNDRTR